MVIFAARFKKLPFYLLFFHRFLFVVLLIIFSACSSLGKQMRTDSSAEGGGVSARGAIGGLGAHDEGPLFTGNGGAGIRLAVHEPASRGNVPEEFSLYIQGMLNNNIGKYSAVTLIDRQNLDRIVAEQKISAGGAYSDIDFIQIGNLTNTEYYLFGAFQSLPGNRYSLQLTITNINTGVVRASSMKEGALMQFQGSGTLINQASAELLEQLGVQLTEYGRQTLLAGNTSVVKAEAELARGITAQASGSEVEALFNYTQAFSFDPSQEAMSRLISISTAISGGTISERIVNDIQARNRWLQVFRETAQFYNDHFPFEIVFDPNLFQIGNTDYAKNTAELGMRVSLQPSQAHFNAINALVVGLEQTGRRDIWGFSGWPLSDVYPKAADTVLFGGKRSFSFKVDFMLINESNKTLGRSNVNLSSNSIIFSPADKIVNPPDSLFSLVNFPNINAVDLTPTLTIAITHINGKPAEELDAAGYIKIVTGDLEKSYISHLEGKDLAVRLDRRNRELESEKIRSQFKNNSKRYKYGLHLGYSPLAGMAIENKNYGGLTAEGEMFFSSFPYVSTGVSLKTFINRNFVNFDGKNIPPLWVSPVVGFVFPVTPNIRLFADASLNMGSFGNLDGLLTNWLTPSFGGGVNIHFWDFAAISLKYRYTMYKKLNENSISLGLGFGNT